jgi:hypothetical protein
MSITSVPGYGRNPVGGRVYQKALEPFGVENNNDVLGILHPVIRANESGYQTLRPLVQWRERNINSSLSIAPFQRSGTLWYIVIFDSCGG